MTSIGVRVAGTTPIGGPLPGAVNGAPGAGRERRGVALTVEASAARGTGDCSPLPGYSPDEVDDDARALAALPPIALDPERPLAAQLAGASAPLAALPAARFALEAALLDLVGQLRGLPAHELLGARAPAPVPLAALVDSIDGAAAAVARGVTTLKVKVGRPGAWLRERALLGAIRDRWGERLHLRVDANRAWDPDTARRCLAELDHLTVAYCEEPVPTAALFDLGPTVTPIALDESLQQLTGADLDRLAATAHVAALVLKPTTLGGITGCRVWAERARAVDAAVTVTHCFDGPVALAAACELALALGGDSAAGLDRHAALAAYPATDVVQLRARDVAPANLPGLGLVAPEGPLSLLAAAREAPDAVALVDAGGERRYRELVEPTVDALRALRQNGVAPGAPVVVRARRTAATIARLHACFERRSPAVLIGRKEDEPRAIERAGGLRGPRAALVVFTSGSSGTAKAVVLSRQALIASAAASATNLGWRDGDRWLACLPLFHIGGASILSRALIARRAVVLAPDGSFDPEVVGGLLVDTRVTLASLVPTMLARLLDADVAPPAQLRAVLLGGAATRAPLLERAATAGWPVLTTYGSSETASQIATARPGRAATAADGSGRPLPGVDLRVGDDGRIRVRGPMLMDRYLPPQPTPIDGDGWLTTADCGYVDDDGNLHVTGRADDTIVSGGENVDPREVEVALEGLPGVRAACVFGVADPVWGQVVAAALVPEGDAELRIAESLRARLEGSRRPRRICFVDRLELGPTGKIDRRATAARCADALRPT